MNDQSVGRLQPVDLRTLWSKEPKFTRWLAEPANLRFLGETLELELELISVEMRVGSFSADIVCRDISTDSMVLIENQFEQTNHDHLGKLLTYAAGIEAVSVVWLAESFRDEHRAALDWLNEITHQDTHFFGLKIELFRIGNSPPAPNFSIISMPNDWSRSARAAGDAELSELQRKQKKYWTGLHARLKDLRGPVHGERKPLPQSWMAYSIGSHGFYLYAAMNTLKNFIRVDLYLYGANAQERLDHLEKKKEEIERDLGYPLEWGSQSPTARERRISYFLRNTNPEDESDWPAQHEWLAEHLNNMHHAFAQRVKNLREL